MDIHNINEDIVISKVNEIFNALEEGKNPEKFCTCNQCRVDTVCYILNRIEPHYLVSNRGVARVDRESHEWQQKEADIVALVYEGIKRVNHNQRPNANHTAAAETVNSAMPVFNIPTIIGRLFNGLNFAPLSGIQVELRREGEIVPMKNLNWQNPYNLVSNTEGTFTFWPVPIPSEAINIRKIFEYSIKVEAPGFEELNHFFKIPVISEIQTAPSFSMGRTFKLPDLYLFPPGGDENDDFSRE
jgi:competence protein ComFB